MGSRWTGISVGYQHTPACKQLVRDLNRLYRSTPALYELDYDPHGFEWIDWNDRDNSVFSWIQRDRHGGHLIVVSNLTPVVAGGILPRCARRRSLPRAINTNALDCGGTGVGNLGSIDSESSVSHGRPNTLRLTLPPLATLILSPAAAPTEQHGDQG